jgi:hypothetical protein
VVLRGRRVADDADRDLVLLEVDWPDHPEPIPLARSLTWRDDMRALTFAFPEARGRRVPRPCVALPGRVFGSYQDGAGGIVTFAFAAEHESWHSGGPVVDGRGSLLGLVGPLELGLRSSSVLPAPRIASFLDGRVQTLQVVEETVEPGLVCLGIEVELFDPLGRVEGLRMLTYPSEVMRFDVPVGADGRWPRLGDPIASCELELNQGLARGRAELESAEMIDREMVYQVEARTSDGVVWWSAPRSFTARFSGG